MKTAKVFVVLSFSLVLILAALLIYKRVKAEPTGSYYSPSLQMAGTYDWDEAMYSWNPTLLPGYNIDMTNINCVGAVRVNFSNYRCVGAYQWYYEPLDGKYYLTAHLEMPQLCNLNSATFQPFLDVYNPTNGAHDRIYGNSMSVDFSWCYPGYMPIIKNSDGQMNQNAYPGPQSQSESMPAKKSKVRSTPYP